MNVIDDQALQKVIDEAIDHGKGAAEEIVAGTIKQLDTLASAKIKEIEQAIFGILAAVQAEVKPVLTEIGAMRAQLDLWHQLLSRLNLSEPKP